MKTLKKTVVNYKNVKKASSKLYEQNMWIDNLPCIKHITRKVVKIYSVSWVFKKLDVDTNNLIIKLISNIKIPEAFTTVGTQATHHTFSLTCWGFHTHSFQFWLQTFIIFFSPSQLLSSLTTYFSASCFIKETEAMEGLPWPPSSFSPPP